MERSLTPKGRRAREKILVVAERLFAANGFHGTSMRDVAAAARYPLASTIYHFAKKEQLYAAVLELIATDLDVRLGVVTGDPVDALAIALVRWAREEPGRVKLLLRELLDNPTRVAKAAKLPLGPFLQRAAKLVAASNKTADSPETTVLHLVGAISYFVASWPTVERIVGPERAKQIQATYETEAIAFARRMLGPVGDKSRGGLSAGLRT
ncbi:MAG: TetR family transcriptional regulator [Kofleriaceae bacterium]